MRSDIKAKFAQEFQRFLRSMQHEVDPESHMYRVLYRTFLEGFSAGGKVGSQMVADEIKADLMLLDKPTPQIDDDWQE